MTPRTLVMTGGGALVVSLVTALLLSQLASSPPRLALSLLSWLSQTTLFTGVGLLVAGALVSALRTPAPVPQDEPPLDWYA